ncbi:Ku protein [Candidatus Berkelbacteria bacterium]|nr:Ku protein [Candidatus Berkelbacteria bacterium]
MRSIWTGSLVLGLVNIPIKLFSVIEQRSISFRLLDDKDYEPIRYQRVSEKTGQVVDWENIVKGFEVTPGKFYVLSRENIKKLKPTKSDAIQIIEFINKDQVDEIYFNKNYYLAPKEEGRKAFFLFKKALEEAGKVAIANFVMREREHYCMIEPHGKGILITTLFYQEEIRSMDEIAELEGAAPKLTADEMELARLIIDKKTHKSFDISKFKDEFSDNLIKATKGKKIEQKEIKKSPNLIEALKASVK